MQSDKKIMMQKKHLEWECSKKRKLDKEIKRQRKEVEGVRITVNQGLSEIAKTKNKDAIIN